MRLILLIVVAVLAANPCLARNSHSHHGAGANSTSNAVNARHPNGTNRSPSITAIDAEATVAPPVLPAHGITRQQIGPINLSGKTTAPANLSRGRTGAMTVTAPIVRNAIGQPVAAAKSLAGAQSPALQRPGPASPLIFHAQTAAPPALSPAAERLNLANAINRGGVNGATVIRPVAGSSGIGGPARSAYGINGTTMQNRR